MKELGNSIADLEEILSISKKGEKVGVVYSKDYFISNCSNCTDSRSYGIENFEKVSLKEGYFIKDRKVFARKGTMVVFQRIDDDLNGIIGVVIIGGTEEEEPVYCTCYVLEDDEDSEFIGEKVYVI